MKVISSERMPIKMWLENIEDGALSQAKDIANLPFVFKHIAIMPDSHQGYGMPIGGVMATKGVIVPNAVGVDIGCLDKNTEFLTQSGWQKISDYQKGDNILQYNKETNIASYVSPIAYIVKPCDTFFHFKNSKGLDQMVSEEHKMLIWKGYKTRGYNLEDIGPIELSSKGKSLSKGFYGFKASFNLANGFGVDMTNDEIRLDIMITADGCIKHSKENTHQIYLHFKKVRKIKRAKELLTRNNIFYKETAGKDGSTHMYFFVDKKYSKNLSKYWLANRSQLKVISEECLLWDGHVGYRPYFSSTDKESADLIQFAFSSVDIRAGICTVNSKNPAHKTIYFVTPTRNNIVGINVAPTIVKSKDKKKYCFTVPSGYFVARRNGKIFITGNCGMMAVRTSLTDISTDRIKQIMGEIRKVIPVGFKHNKTAQSWEGFSRAPDISIIQNQLTSARKQLGTLGSGNHFVEIQKGDDGHIWIMLHSGSRNFGLKVASEYHKKAKFLCEKWYSSVPKDLAFLPIESPEGKEYYEAMNYALEFAQASRDLIMEKILDNIETNVLETVNIHHNFAAFEHHFGKDVLVHRKGATRAYKGEIGIIPGSMGTSSYIVEGLGNPDSFMSCSHGAGRRMGRGQAKRTLSLVEEQEKMEGVVHGLRTSDDLDEAPGAYKDIDVVMEDQKDLVKILVKLTPLASIKG